jgi:PAS domain-containing protein
MKNIKAAATIADSYKKMSGKPPELSEFLCNIPAIVAMTSGSEHTFVMANDNYLQLIGNIDVIGKTVREVRPELESQGFLEILDQVYITGNSFSATEKLVRIGSEGNGKVIHAYLNFVYQAFKNSGGEIEGILLFANDVTAQVLERKKAEESEKRYRLIVETSQEGIWIIDKDKRTTFVNDKLCKLLEYTPDEMIGKVNTSFMDFEGQAIAADADDKRELGKTEKVDIS